MTFFFQAALPFPSLNFYFFVYKIYHPVAKWTRDRLSIGILKNLIYVEYERFSILPTLPTSKLQKIATHIQNLAVIVEHERALLPQSAQLNSAFEDYLYQRPEWTQSIPEAIFPTNNSGKCYPYLDESTTASEFQV